jgi:hypothetical protein
MSGYGGPIGKRLYNDDPRLYALELADSIGPMAVLHAVVLRMSDDDVRDALNANKLSPRFSDPDRDME